MNDWASRSYPKTLETADDEVSVAEMTAADRGAMLAFARALPEHDLLFLRRDISQEEGVEGWIADIEAGLVTTLLARIDGDLVGYVTVHRNALRWSRHVGELRVVVAPAARGRGLGRLLTQEAFLVALEGGIEKLVARMTPDQRGAIGVFEGLGFRAEAILRDHVRDRDGNDHDLLVMSQVVAEFETMLEAYGVAESVAGER